MNPELDGIEHINIYSKGKTHIGRLLSNFAHTPFSLGKEEGVFQSVEGYWYWLLTGFDGLRDLHGYEAKKVGKEHLPLMLYRPWERDEFKDKIRHAMGCKMWQNLHVRMSLRCTDLPFMHYYVWDSGPKDAGYKWVVEFWEEKRREQKEGRWK